MTIRPINSVAPDIVQAVPDPLLPLAAPENVAAPAAKAAGRRAQIWEGAKSIGSTVADYTIPTRFRQLTLPSVRQYKERIEACYRVLNTKPTQAGSPPIAEAPVNVAATAAKTENMRIWIWKGVKSVGNTVADYTVPTWFRQSTLPTVQQHQERIEAYHRVLNTSPTQAPITDYQPKTDEQRKKFARNLSEFATLKTIYEVVCGLTVDSSMGNLYNELMDRPAALSEEQSQSKLRERFFEHLDTRDISLFKKWAAYLCYDILNYIFHDFIETISSDFLKDVREKIEREENTSSFAHLGNQCIQFIAGYLETLKSAYRVIQNKDFVCRSMDQEVALELNNGLERRGYTQAVLNKKSTQKFVQKYSYSIKLSAVLEKKIKSLQIPETSSFSLLNRPLSVLTSTLAWVVWATLYVPLAAINLAIAYAFKILLTKIDPVDAIVSNSVSAMKHPNGYTHALNRAIYKQLKDVFELIQKPPSPTETPTIKLNGLKPLIENLQEILILDQLGTREKLIEYFRNKERPKGVIKSAAEWTGQKICYKATGTSDPNDVAVEAIIKVISSAFEGFMKKDQLEEQLYNVLNQLNMIYTRDAVIDPSEFEATEKGITEMTDAIINSLLDDNLKTAFIGTDKQLTEFKDKYVAQLQASTEQITKLGAQVTQINFNHDLDQGALRRNLQALNLLIRQVIQIEANISLTHRRIEATPPSILGAADKRDLAERFAIPLNHHLDALKNAILEAHTCQQKILANKATVLPPLATMVLSLDAIQTGTKLDVLDIELLRNSCACAEEAFRNLSAVGTFQQFTTENQEEFIKISQHFTAVEQNKLTQTILTPCHTLLEQMFQATPIERGRLATELRTQLTKLLNKTHRDSLLNSFDELRGCSESQKEEKLAIFTALQQGILNRANEQLASEKLNLTLVSENLFRVFTDKELPELQEQQRLLNNLEDNRAKILEALEKVPSFANSSTQPPWTFWGFPGKVMRACGTGWRWAVNGTINMNGPHDLIQDTALGILKQNTDRLLNFVRKEHNYTHGVFNHLLFIPFIES